MAVVLSSSREDDRSSRHVDSLEDVRAISISIRLTWARRKKGRGDKLTIANVSVAKRTFTYP